MTLFGEDVKMLDGALYRAVPIVGGVPGHADGSAGHLRQHKVISNFLLEKMKFSNNKAQNCEIGRQEMTSQLLFRTWTAHLSDVDGGWWLRGLKY